MLEHNCVSLTPSPTPAFQVSRNYRRSKEAGDEDDDDGIHHHQPSKAFKSTNTSMHGGRNIERKSRHFLHKLALPMLNSPQALRTSPKACSSKFCFLLISNPNPSHSFISYRTPFPLSPPSLAILPSRHPSLPLLPGIWATTLPRSAINQSDLPYKPQISAVILTINNSWKNILMARRLSKLRMYPRRSEGLYYERSMNKKYRREKNR